MNGIIRHLLFSVELFNEPVDPVKYQIPTYFAVIGGQQNARDLGTIKANLVADRYNSIGEFEADVRLMLKNCFTFNAPTTPVEVIGRDLEKAFDLAMVKVRKDAGLPPTAGSANAGNKRKGAEPAASSKRSRVG
jgi:transcription initiation factor TFIID subunit 2